MKLQEVNKFCGVRFEKIKNFGAMIGKEKHNLRADVLEFGDNINLDLSEKNRIWKFNNYQDNIVDTYNFFLSKCEKKPRKDHIKAFEYLFYRSDCFDLDCEYENYKNCTINFIKEYFDGCPVCVIEHNVEAVQHFHVFVIPCKEKDGEFKFCGSDFCAKKKMLSDLQTFYANHCKSCGLVRGKEKSLDKHIKIQEYYEQESKKQIEEFEKIIEYNESLLEKNKQLINENIAKNELLESMNSGLDAEINKYRNIDKDEKIKKFQDSIAEFINVLDEQLNNDDGTEYFEAIRFCLKLLKSVLVKYNFSEF